MSKEGQPVVNRDCNSTFNVDLSVSVLKLSGHVDLLGTKFIFFSLFHILFIYHFYFF